MLELCGHPFEYEAFQLFHNMLFLNDDIPLELFGIREWSVVDVVVEENEMQPSEVEKTGGDGVCRADYREKTRANPEYMFAVGELQHVMELSISLSGLLTSA